MGSRKAKMARTRPWDSPRGLICSTPLAQSADMMQDLRKMGLIRDQNLVFILWLDGIPDQILVWLLDVFGMVIWQTQNICWTSLIYIGIINDGGQHEVVIFYGHPSQNGNPNIMTIELQSNCLDHGRSSYVLRSWLFVPAVIVASKPLLVEIDWPWGSHKPCRFTMKFGRHHWRDSQMDQPCEVNKPCVNILQLPREFDHLSPFITHRSNVGKLENMEETSSNFHPGKACVLSFLRPICSHVARSLSWFSAQTTWDFPVPFLASAMGSVQNPLSSRLVLGWLIGLPIMMSYDHFISIKKQCNNSLQ